MQNKEQKESKRTDKTVLIAEDDPSLRRVAEKLFKRLGFEILSVSNGEDALKVFKENHDRICLSFFDWQMPLLNGVGAIKKLRELKPDLPVILSSGHPAATVLDGFPSGEQVCFIQKPYNLGAVSQAVDKALKPQ